MTEQEQQSPRNRANDWDRTTYIHKLQAVKKNRNYPTLSNKSLNSGKKNRFNHWLQKRMKYKKKWKGKKHGVFGTISKKEMKVRGRIRTIQTIAFNTVNKCIEKKFGSAIN